MRVTLVLFAVAMLATTTVNACGFTTHNVVFHRAISYFWKSQFAAQGYQELLNKYINLVSAGAPFPDYLYTCGNDHDAGEQSHWPPFHAAAARYIRSRPKPWDEQTNKLVAFMFGAISHYIADDNWHGLEKVPYGYGFIQTLGIQDYNCTGDLCGTAHSAADTGGEFVAAFQSDLSWFAPSQWEVPAEDLVNIFAMIGKTVNVSDISKCQLEFTAGALAIKYLSYLAFTEITTKSPFLVEHYVDHHLGGIDDMSVWTTRMWDRFAEWIEYGPPIVTNLKLPAHRQHFMGFYKKAAGLLKDSPLLPELQRLDKHTAPAERSRVLQQIRQQLLEQLTSATPSPIALEAQRLMRELSVMMGGDANMDLLTVLKKTQQQEEQLSQERKGDANFGSIFTSATEVSSLSSTQPLDYLGGSLSAGDLNGDGIEDLVMGAWGKPVPGEGQVGNVYITFGQKGDIPSTLPTTTLSGVATNGRFGWATAVLDWNLDGIEDLVVASPISGWNWTAVEGTPEYPYYGTVNIWFGKRGLTSFAAQPDVLISAQERLSHFGTSLTTGDIDGDGHDDLIIGSPNARGNVPGESEGNAYQRGTLHGFVSRPDRVLIPSLTDSAAELILYGPEQFGWFGTSSVVAQANGQSLLLVGASGYRNAAGTYGRVYAYTIGSPAALSSLSAASAIKAAPTVFTITGSQQQAKFGHALAFGKPIDNTYMLAVSAASFDTGSLTPHAGLVYVLDISSLHGDLSIDQVTTHTTLGGVYYGARLGWNLAFIDANHDGLDELMAAAPLLSNGITEAYREVGRVAIWPSGSNFPSGNKSGADFWPPWSVDGPTKFGRFGHSFLAVDLNGDGKHELVVGAPYADGPAGAPAQEMAGKVHVYATPTF